VTELHHAPLPAAGYAMYGDKKNLPTIWYKDDEKNVECGKYIHLRTNAWHLKSGNTFFRKL
jgi:hypothetical protein